LLLGHRSPPVAPDVDASPDRKRQPAREEDEPDGGEPRILVVDAVTPQDPHADEDEDQHDDHDADPQLPRPRDPAPLHAEGRCEPVQQECRPADGEDELDGSQTRSITAAIAWPKPMHIVARPKRASRRSSSETSVAVMRAPVAPSGWPREMPPPLG